MVLRNNCRIAFQNEEATSVVLLWAARTTRASYRYVLSPTWTLSIQSFPMPWKRAFHCCIGNQAKVSLLCRI